MNPSGRGAALAVGLKAGEVHRAEHAGTDYAVARFGDGEHRRGRGGLHPPQEPLPLAEGGAHPAASCCAAAEEARSGGRSPAPFLIAFHVRLAKAADAAGLRAVRRAAGHVPRARRGRAGLPAHPRRATSPTTCWSGASRTGAPPGGSRPGSPASLQISCSARSGPGSSSASPGGGGGLMRGRSFGYVLALPACSSARCSPGCWRCSWWRTSSTAPARTPDPTGCGRGGALRVEGAGGDPPARAGGAAAGERPPSCRCSASRGELTAILALAFGRRVLYLPGGGCAALTAALGLGAVRRVGGGARQPAGGRDHHAALPPLGRLAFVLRAQAVVPAPGPHLPPRGRRRGVAASRTSPCSRSPRSSSWRERVDAVGWSTPAARAGGWWA